MAGPQMTELGPTASMSGSQGAPYPIIPPGVALNPGDERFLANLLSQPKLTPATMARYLDPRWIPSPHLMYISLRIAIALSRGAARIIISLPPRHGKSRISSIGTSVWALEKWPHKEIALTSYGADLSEEFSTKVRDQITKNPHKLDVRLRANSNRVDRFLTTKGGSVIAVGTGGVFTGRGADILFVDDFIKDHKEAMSHTSREFTWNWFTTTAMTRLEPGASVVIVATRWHEDDLIGRLLDRFPGVWEYIRIPAIAEAGDLLGREVGQALFPERYNIEYLLQWRKILGTKMFDAMYQQDPRSDETRMANKEWVNICTELPNHNHLKWARVWDLAATQGGGDYTTGGLHCIDIHTRIMFTADMKREQLSPENVERLVKKCAEEDGPTVPILIEQEPGSSGKALVSHFARNVLKGYKVIGIPTTKAKAVNAQAWLAGCEAGRYYILRGAWNDTFLREFDHFPTGEYDDQEDNGAIAWNYLIGKEKVQVVWGRQGLTEGKSTQLLVDQYGNPIRKSFVVPPPKQTARGPVKGATWGRAKPNGTSGRPKGSGLIFQNR